MKPVTSQAPRSSAGELTSRAMSADTIKMPDPIIEPITSMVALVRPSALTSSLSWWEWISQSLAGGGVDALVWVLTSLLQVERQAAWPWALGRRLRTRLRGWQYYAMSAVTVPQNAEKFLC